MIKPNMHYEPIVANSHLKNFTSEVIAAKWGLWKVLELPSEFVKTPLEVKKNNHLVNCYYTEKSDDFDINKIISYPLNKYKANK